MEAAKGVHPCADDEDTWIYCVVKYNRRKSTMRGQFIDNVFGGKGRLLCLEKSSFP